MNKLDNVISPDMMMITPIINPAMINNATAFTANSDMIYTPFCEIV